MSRWWFRLTITRAILEELRATRRRLSPKPTWRLAQEGLPHHRRVRRRHQRTPGREAEADAPARVLDIRAPKLMDLRYGENPHQSAALYGTAGAGIAGAEQLHGKELSYNNLVDLDAAWQLVREFECPAAAIIKHTNPCGCAERGDARRSLPARRLSATRSRPMAA